MLDPILSWRPSRHTLQRRGYTSMSDSNCVRSLPRAFRSCRRMGPEWVAQLYCSTGCFSPQVNFASIHVGICPRSALWLHVTDTTSQSRKHMFLMVLDGQHQHICAAQSYQSPRHILAFYTPLSSFSWYFSAPASVHLRLKDPSDTDRNGFCLSPFVKNRVYRTHGQKPLKNAFPR